MNEIECPYCLYEFENYTDPFDQEEEKEMQCPRCQEYFMVRCTYSASYEAYKIGLTINQSEKRVMNCPKCKKEITEDPAGTGLWHCTKCKYAWKLSELIQGSMKICSFDYSATKHIANANGEPLCLDRTWLVYEVVDGYPNCKKCIQMYNSSDGDSAMFLDLDGHFKNEP